MACYGLINGCSPKQSSSRVKISGGTTLDYCAQTPIGSLPMGLRLVGHCFRKALHCGQWDEGNQPAEDIAFRAGVCGEEPFLAMPTPSNGSGVLDRITLR